MSISEPSKFLIPWADSGLKNPIPMDADPVTGRAGLDQGFPAINMTPKESGGIPPFGQDFNGIFFDITSALRYMQAGGRPTFSPELSASIGGYPKGAIVIGDDGLASFQNSIDSNASNPNSGGSGWTRVDPYALTQQSGSLTPDASWADVPSYSDPNFGDALNAQAEALTSRSLVLKARGDGYLYDQIRSYTGDETRLICIGRTNIFDNANGIFFLDANNHNGIDNDGTLLVDVLGRRWKRQWTGWVLPEWFGLKGDGVADDTASLLNSLAAGKHVVISSGLTPLISATITVPVRTKLEFLGGLGNTPNQLPASYLIKKSTMTTAGIVVSERGEVVGGGISCQAGNSGDGIQLAGNSARLLDFYAVGAGRDGIRVGTDGVFVNCNSVYQYRNRSTDNGRYGIYIHDGVSVGPADANIGSLVDCVAHRNGADGIRLGHCFWTTVQNCNAEGNTGYGLYLSGIANSTYPECRWPIIIGGDFNEGNNGTNNVDQVYDGAYFSTFIVSDSFSVATDAPTALQGGGLRNTFSPRANAVIGMTVNASAGGIDATPLIAENVQTGGNTYPSVVRQRTFASNGSGPGIKFKIDPNTGTYVDAAAVSAIQNSPGKYGPRLTGYNAGVPTYVALDTSVAAFYPGTDNAISCGHTSLKWSVVYSWTGTINTSDAREKTALHPISDAVLDAWGATQLGMFQWLDAIQKKGEDVARWHFGRIAQQVRDAFLAHGLDGTRYGLLCYDEWGDEYEPVMEEFEEEVTVIDGKGQETIEIRVVRRETGDMELIRPAGNRWGIRPDQCAFLEAAYQRRRCDRIEARLVALEAK